MRRFGSIELGIVTFAVSLLGSAPTSAVFLDEGREIRLGLRTYVGARIGTQDTTLRDFTVSAAPDAPRRAAESLTFPYSASGHLRQNRFFAEVDLEHDVLGLVKSGFGPLALFRKVPDLHRLQYHLTFRGEYEGVYDWGPSEFRTAEQYEDIPASPIGPTFGAPGQTVDILAARRRLRDIGSHRERLFQAFVDAEIGDLFMRFGRQNLSWGETDAFRLLDQINPLDSSFGGFLIPLDERRVPLDMLRVKYYLGSLGFIEEAFIEMYGAIDNDVSFSPGAAQGSAWTLPNLGRPSAVVLNETFEPARNFEDMRGGGRVVWNMFTGTFSLAHYYTYFDIPTVDVTVAPGFPVQGRNQTFPDGYSSHTFLRPQRGQITGGTATFAIPQLWVRPLYMSGEPIIRAEFAFFRDEPRYRQEELDPFLFKSAQGARCRPSSDPNMPIPPDCLGNGRRTGNSTNFVIGIDHNQYFRWLNPNASFFITTQFFYKHLLDAAKRKPLNPALPFLKSGEVLPVPDYVVEGVVAVGEPLEPVFVKQPTDQFLQTLAIATNYYSGQINPAVVLFYDWEGAWVFQPGITFIHDPFRFSIDYSFLTAGTLKGGSGVSLLRDRDNVYFRLEYVI
jgi:hypothetical protein